VNTEGKEEEISGSRRMPLELVALEIVEADQ